MTPLKIFIGTSTHSDDKQAEKVLEYTLRKNSSKPLEIFFMRNTPDNFFGGFDNSTWWTPFSYLRWAIPEYCDFKGRALYMDVDQVNFRDISELHDMDLENKPLAVREGDYRSCVCVLDCEKLNVACAFYLKVNLMHKSDYSEVKKKIKKNEKRSRRIIGSMVR